LNIIGTIDKPTKGEITICGQRQRWRDGLTRVLAMRPLLPDLTLTVCCPLPPPSSRVRHHVVDD
jgi:hypothetical protein